MITQERLKQLFEYRADGGLYYKEANKYNTRIQAGDRAGTINPAGYRVIIVNNRQYFEHRLVWLFHYGLLDTTLDHINQLKSDNRIENLRHCTRSQNGSNRGTQVNNTSGFKGVKYHKTNKKWVAAITAQQVRQYLGTFTCKYRAAIAYNRAAIKLFGEYAALNLIRPR